MTNQSLVGGDFPAEMSVDSRAGFHIFHAAEQGDEEWWERHVHTGQDVNRQDGDGKTALHWACTCDQPETVEFLLSRGAHVNAVNVCGHTALHEAALTGCHQIVRVLTEAGAESNLCDISSHTPLHIAGQYNCTVLN